LYIEFKCTKYGFHGFETGAVTRHNILSFDGGWGLGFVIAVLLEPF